MTDTITETEPAAELPDVKSEKPRGDCTGCGFSYQLSTCRKGELKGQLIIRKHLSRTGPGECSGSQELPKWEECQHLQGFLPAEDAQGRGGAFCPECGDREPEAEPGDVFTVPAAIDTEAGDGSQGMGPWVVAIHDGECDGVCTGSILEGEQIRSDGTGGWLCSECGDPDTRASIVAHSMSDAIAAVGSVVGIDPAGTARSPGAVVVHAAQVPMISTPSPAAVTVPFTGPAPVSGMVAKSGEDQFTAPGPASDIPEGSVSMQPDPERDRWGRYLILGQPNTRTTTFVKSASSTFTLNQWQQRMTVKGLTLRPDLLALAHGLDVKADKQTLNSIAEQAKEAAGQKVAANLGSAYHAFSERLDAGLITLADIPAVYRHRLEQYQDVIRRAGLTTRPEWIERTTAVRADQVSAALPVAGMLDRIWQLPNGELVIGDLKTGSDLSYGWGEITAQLAVYAHGVNTHGLFDWNRKVWQQHVDVPGGMMPMNVRTDFAIVMHLPADGDGCTLYRVDLVAGWRRAQICGHVMALNKEKDLAFPITVPDVVREEAPAVTAPQPAIAAPQVTQPSPNPGHSPQQAADWDTAVQAFYGVDSKARAAELYGYAQSSGKFTEENLSVLASIAQGRLQALGLG